jgi:hypothetical protein
MIDYNIDQYIGIFKNVYPNGFCGHLIEKFRQLKLAGQCQDRRSAENVPEALKCDISIGLHSPMLEDIGVFNNIPAEDTLWNGLQQCYDVYSREFPVLEHRYSRPTTSHTKLQETSRRGGYHIWHAEQDSTTKERCIVYMVYLNTLPVESCGETEFLYQEKRIRPVENTVVLWPAAYTHAHRGNPVYGDIKKYVATGWFNL